MERWQGRVAVVTGTSSGIGAAIAYQLQDAGVHVVALARRKEIIEEAVAGARKEAQSRGRASIGKAATPGKLHALKCDLTSEEDILAVFKYVKDNLGVVHILVNNAGSGSERKLAGTDTATWRRILNLNVLGLSICTREAIQIMKAKGVDDGHIIHIGSKAGHAILNIPDSAMYSASKHAVRVLTEGLRKELVAAKSKIRVTEVSPGAVKTGFGSDVPLSADIIAAFGATTMQEIWTKLPHLQSEDVADAVLYALSVPSHVQIHEVIMAPVGEAF